MGEFQPFDWQAAAVSSFDDLGGLFLAAPAGRGKTWVNAQCCKRARVAVYVCPAGVLTQTRDKLRAYGVRAFAKAENGFGLAKGPRTNMISYSALSRRPELLAQLAGDVPDGTLVLDEGHRTKRVSSAQWSKAIAKFISAYPGWRVVFSTGSVMHRSVVDYGHGLVWALRRGAPCGSTPTLIEQCARRAAEDPAWWRETLRATPGVFMVDDEGGYTGELVTTTEKLPPLAAAAYKHAAETGEAPDGWVCEDRLSQDELLRQLAWGFYMRREPRPSAALVVARRTWAKLAEGAITYGLAANEPAARTLYPTEYRRYAEAEAREPGEQVVEWLEVPRVWAEPGTICWVNHPALAERLSLAKGWPYYHEQAMCVREHLSKATAPVVLASIRACSEGVDGAQLRYNKHLVLEPPSDPRVWEQMIARLARQGQPCAQVELRVQLRGGIHQNAWLNALEGARRIQEETGQKQWLTRTTAS